MFSYIDHDSRNNLYCWYDYKGVPSRWVEITGRMTWKFNDFDRHVSQKMAALGLLRSFPDIEKRAKTGWINGYWWTHLHPIGFGGGLFGKGFTNLSLMPHDLNNKFVHFMNGWYYGNLQIPKKLIAAEGHKIFINIPILPIVVSSADVPFLTPLNSIRVEQQHNDMLVKGHDILVAMTQQQKQASSVCDKKWMSIHNKKRGCIYPPPSLIGKIEGTQTIAGGPSEPELVVTRARRLFPPVQSVNTLKYRGR